MEKTMERRDTFIVREKVSSHNNHSHTKTATLPGGQRVHSLDREVLDRAIKAAVKALREKARA